MLLPILVPAALLFFLGPLLFPLAWAPSLTCSLGLLGRWRCNITNTYKGLWRGCRRRGWPSSPTAARWTPSSPPPPPPRWWWMSPRAPTLLCTARYPGSSPGNLLRVTDALSRWAFTRNLISIDDCSRLKFINGSDD